jgi:hypothetical protein
MATTVNRMGAENRLTFSMRSDTRLCHIVQTEPSSAYLTIAELDADAELVVVLV